MWIKPRILTFNKAQSRYAEIDDITRGGYSGPKKWWSPSDNSTFMPVPDKDLGFFEEHILKPYFGITLAEFGL